VCRNSGYNVGNRRDLDPRTGNDPLSVVRECFGAPRALVGRLHLGALPGTPSASQPVETLIQQALTEAQIYRDAGFTALAIENMHDRPCLKGGVGPQITAAMTALAREVKRETGLAGVRGNQEEAQRTRDYRGRIDRRDRQAAASCPHTRAPSAARRRAVADSSRRGV
jgi:hypothetical protein